MRTGGHRTESSQAHCRDRAIHLQPPRRQAGQRPVARRGGQIGAHRSGTRRFECVYLVEAAGGAHMERVMDATTLPTLLLGGDPEDDPDETYAAWESALKLPSVRGLVVGRTMLYPADDDVAKAVDTAVSLLR